MCGVRRPPERGAIEEERPTKKPAPSINDVLMGKHVLQMKFLHSQNDLDVDPPLDMQILTKLYELFENIELGYVDGLQEAQLSLNAKHIKDTLCFVQSYWAALLRAEFPAIPNNGVDSYHSSKLLELIKTTHRNKKKE